MLKEELLIVLRKRFTVIVALILALTVVGCDRAANNGSLKLTGTVETTMVVFLSRCRAGLNSAPGAGACFAVTLPAVLTQGVALEDKR